MLAGQQFVGLGGDDGHVGRAHQLLAPRPVAAAAGCCVAESRPRPADPISRGAGGGAVAPAARPIAVRARPAGLCRSGFFSALWAASAQHAHELLVELVEHIVRVAAAGALPGAACAGRVVQFVDQLFQRDLRVLHQRLHGVDGLQRGVDVDRVVDLEDGLADLVAAPGGAADHLLVQDARAHPAHEDEMADGRHVDAGGQQVHGDGDAGQALVLVAADQLVDLVGRRR